MAPAAGEFSPLDLQNEANSFVNGGGTEIGNRAGDLQRAVRGILRYLVNQAEFPGLATGKDPPGEGEFQGSPRAQSGLDGTVYKERPEAEANFGQTEGGLVGGDDDVAIRHQPGPTGEGRAVNAGDEGFGEAGAGGEELFVDGVDFAGADLFGNNGLLDLGQVHAGAEGLPIAGEEDGGYGRDRRQPLRVP